MKSQTRTSPRDKENNIAEYIYNPFPTSSIGLNYGTSRKMIIYGALSHLTKNEKFNDEVIKCLFEVFDKSDTIDEFDYSNGVLGVGWAIEWMIQNKLLSPKPHLEDIDDLLESIDQLIIRFVSYANLTDISVNTGIIGFLKYMERRFKSISTQSHRYKLIGLLEIIVMLTDDLFRSIENLSDATEIKVQELVNIGNVYRTLTQAALPVNQPTIEKTIGICENILIKEIVAKMNTNGSYDETLDLLYISITYYIGAKKRLSVNKKLEAQNFINDLMKYLNFDFPLSNHYLYRQSQVLTLIHIHFQGVSLQAEYDLTLDFLRKSSKKLLGANNPSKFHDDFMLLDLARNKELHCLEELIYF